MNSSAYQSSDETFSSNFIVVVLGLLIISINGLFVVTCFKSPIFFNNPRYILYIHLVINDMIMVFVSVVLFVMVYTWHNVIFSFCCPIIIIASTTQKNTPLNLAAMAIERYFAICKPLHHPHICTVHRTYILILLIWVVGMIPPLIDLIISAIIFPFFIFETVKVCASAQVYTTIYHDQKNVATNVIYTSFVWVVLVFTYFRVLLTAKRMSSAKDSARKAQSTIILHGVQQLLCMLSFTTPVLDLLMSRILPEQKKRFGFYGYLVTNLIPRLLSPLIYGVRDHTFSKYLYKTLFCRVHVIKIAPNAKQQH